MSSSDKLTLENFHNYWDALIKGHKELKARVAKIEARLDALKDEVPEAPPEETFPEQEAEL